MCNFSTRHRSPPPAGDRAHVQLQGSAGRGLAEVPTSSRRSFRLYQQHKPTNRSPSTPPQRPQHHHTSVHQPRASCSGGPSPAAALARAQVGERGGRPGNRVDPAVDRSQPSAHRVHSGVQRGGRTSVGLASAESGVSKVGSRGECGHQG